MALKVHVNGPAMIRWGTGGSTPFSNPGLQTLGYTEDGVELEFLGHFEDIYADFPGGGPYMPVEVQLMGEEARVSANLIIYDTAILNTALTRSTSATTGRVNEQIGNLMGECYLTGCLEIVRYTGLCNATTEDDYGYFFPRAYVVDTYSKKIGTRATRVRVVWRCLPAASGSLSILFTKVVGN